MGRSAQRSWPTPWRLTPFLEWLELLPAWDDKPRIDELLENLFGCEPSETNRWASRYLTLGAVQRADDPGAKLDTMPVLIGEQGIGKSALLRELLPPDYPEWFSDGLHLADHPKVRAEAILGRVTVEVSEMAGSTRADLESLKSFVSRRDDGAVRLAYRRNPEPTPRRCIIVGTTNRERPLPNDPSGNRRFLPVELQYGTNIEAFMDKEREQLWAEAVFRHRRLFEDAKLPRRLHGEAAEAAEKHRNQDVIIEDAIGNRLHDGKTFAPGEYFTLAEVATGLGMKGPDGTPLSLSMRDTKRLASALRNAGFYQERVQRDGVRGSYWVHYEGAFC